MDSTKKKLIIPFITFLALMAVNVNTIARGINEHQTWRIVAASVSGLLMIAFAVFILVRLAKDKKERAADQ
jgi:large-conductance mechanosensitive channel